MRPSRNFLSLYSNSAAVSGDVFYSFATTTCFGMFFKVFSGVWTVKLPSFTGACSERSEADLEVSPL